jgi:hypothetical protein
LLASLLSAFLYPASQASLLIVLFFLLLLLLIARRLKEKGKESS